MRVSAPSPVPAAPRCFLVPSPISTSKGLSDITKLFRVLGGVVFGGLSSSCHSCDSSWCPAVTSQAVGSVARVFQFMKEGPVGVPEHVNRERPEKVGFRGSTRPDSRSSNPLEAVPGPGIEIREASHSHGARWREWLVRSVVTVAPPFWLVQGRRMMPLELHPALCRIHSELSTQPAPSASTNISTTQHPIPPCHSRRR
jgi:hypothetical protein